MKEIHDRVTEIDQKTIDQNNENHVWLVDQLRMSLTREKILITALKNIKPKEYRSYVGEEKLKKMLIEIDVLAKDALDNVEYLLNDAKGKIK